MVLSVVFTKIVLIYWHYLYVFSVRKLGKPPHLIMRIMDCVMLLFQRRLDIPMVQDPEKDCPKPSWAEALKVMSAGNFLSGLLTFPKVCHSIAFQIVKICNIALHNLAEWYLSSLENKITDTDTEKGKFIRQSD